MPVPQQNAIDATVIGAGLAGMAACIHLARAGFRVQCIAAQIDPTDTVGESLDWSAPALLAELGLPMQDLLDQSIATSKNHVVLALRDGAEQDYTPGEWLGRPPYNVNLGTLHVNRILLNRRVHEVMLASGVTTVQDKVARVENDGNTVTAIVTLSGRRIASPWFLDATGSGASLFPRHFGSPVREYGPKKVAMWDHFQVAETVAGTTLYADGAGPPYMEWVWQIPIHAGTMSVGYVATAESIKQRRHQGLSVEAIFAAQLEKFPALRSLKLKRVPHTTSFRCRHFMRITGSNWIAIGESAAMIDPMTSNGVTAALRQATEAVTLIACYRHRRALPWLPAALYRWRVQSLARFFNSTIENVLYDWPVRNRIGPFRAGEVYTIPAWSLNAIYSRLRPRGWLKTAAFATLVNAARLGAICLHAVCSYSAKPADKSGSILAENAAPHERGRVLSS